LLCIAIVCVFTFTYKEYKMSETYEDETGMTGSLYAEEEQLETETGADISDASNDSDASSVSDTDEMQEYTPGDFAGDDLWAEDADNINTAQGNSVTDSSSNDNTGVNNKVTIPGTQTVQGSTSEAAKPTVTIEAPGAIDESSFDSVTDTGSGDSITQGGYEDTSEFIEEKETGTDTTNQTEDKMVDDTKKEHKNETPVILF